MEHEKEKVNKERYKRPALEGFVRAMDEIYWKRTRKLVEKTKKEMTVRVGVVAVISVVLAITWLCLKRKYQG